MAQVRPILIRNRFIDMMAEVWQMFRRHPVLAIAFLAKIMLQAAAVECSMALILNASLAIVLLVLTQQILVAEYVTTTHQTRLSIVFLATILQAVVAAA